MNKPALTIIAACIAAIAHSEQQIQTENAKGVTWSFALSDDGATITSGQAGKPAISTSAQGDVVIPYMLGGKSVVEIGDDAFHGCSSITSIKIPLTVERIGARAFYDCFSIKSLDLPRKCVSLGERAFKGMTRMETISLKGAIAEIPDRLFERCEALEEIDFGKGTVTLSGRVFEGCRNLRKVVFPNTLKTMDGGSSGKGMFGGVKELREVIFNGRPPDMIDVGFPPKCTIRYDDQFSPAWNRWKADNQSITAFSLQETNADTDNGDADATSPGADDSDDDWLSGIETNPEPISDEKDARGKIEELAPCELDAKLAAKWYVLAKSIRADASGEVDSAKRMDSIRKEVLRTAAVALICTGKSSVFKKEIAPLIDNLTDFEDALRSPCEACGEGVDDEDNIFVSRRPDFGSGKVKTECKRCSGSGRCQRPGCKGGEIEVKIKRTSTTLDPGGVVGSDYKKCSSCNGSGRCSFCEGRGYLMVACSKCGGKGWTVNKKHLLAVYRKCAEQALSVARRAVNKKERDDRDESSPSLLLPEESFSSRLITGGRSFVRKHIEKNKNCRIVAITKTGGDVVVCGDNDWASSSCPAILNSDLQKICNRGARITDVCLTELGSYIVLYGVNSAAWSGIPRGMERKLREYNSNYEKLYSATFNDAGDWIVVSDKHYACSETWLREWLSDGERMFGELLAAAVSTDAAVAVYDRGFKFYGNVPEDLKSALRAATFSVRIIKIAGSAWFFASEYGYNYHYKM